jgi:hypothetical protein
MTRPSVAGDIRIGDFDLRNPFSISKLAQIIENAPNLYNDEETTNLIRHLHANTAGYEYRLHGVITRFEQTVKGNSILAPLSVMIAHPMTTKSTMRMYVELEGPDNKVVKQQILNACAMNYSLTLRKVNSKLYQPNSTETTFKMLFAHFQRNGCTLNLLEFQSLGGSFYAYWKDLWAAEALIDPTFGRLPNQAVVDLNDEEKIRNAGYTPYKSYQHLLEILVHSVLKCFALRSSLEVRFQFIVALSLFAYLTCLFILTSTAL